MITDTHILVAEAEAGRRVDHLVLARHPASTRTLVGFAIAAGNILVNGRLARKGDKLRARDAVRILVLAEATDVRVAPNPALPLHTLYADGCVLAFDKPAGQPVHPLRHDETDTLANAMVARYPETVAVGGDPLMPALLHRIDTDTSGLVLAARTSAAYADLRAQFARQSVRKEYLALVRGRVVDAGELEALLVHRGGERHRMAVLGRRPAPEGRRPMRAVTRYEPLQTGPDTSLLRVTIFTGVTHQIRCQLAHAGWPIVGDALYGGGREQGYPRHYLHAHAVVFRHPGTGGELTLACPPPPGFEQGEPAARVGG